MRPREAAVVEVRLEHHGGVAVQELQHRAFADQALLVQPVDDRVVDEGGAALVHHLGLALRIEVLGDVAHDAQQFALPAFAAWVSVFSGNRASSLPAGRRRPPPSGRQGDRHVGRPGVTLGRVRHRSLKLLLVLSAARSRSRSCASGEPRAARRVTADALGHQRVGGVQDALDGLDAVALLAACDVALGEIEIVEDARRRRSARGTGSCS